MRTYRCVALGCGFLAACSGAATLSQDSGGGVSGSGTTEGGSTSGAAATGGGSGTTSAGASSSGSGSSTGGSCFSSALAASLGRTNIMVGFSGADATAAAAPFDVRYIYLSGGLFDGTSPCASCASACTSDGTSCANSAGGCAWWGCWQYDQNPPGETVRDLVTHSEGLTQSPPQIPMFTYYEILQASGLAEGTTEVAAINDQAFLTRYLADFRFLLQQIGNHTAFVHVEPDFWGYAEQLNSDPHQVPAKVAGANPTDCSAMEGSVAGFGQCLVAMARKYAPNVRIGFHASGWASDMDVLGNSDPNFDVAGEAAKVVAFLSACGAGQGDLIFSDISDRDAAYYTSLGRMTWWDDTNATLPDFHQGWAYGKAIADGLGVPLFWWQVPVGNVALNNTCDHWQDNRVDYILGHLDELAGSDAIGVAFGAGATCMTTPESDNGNLIAKTLALTPEPVCGK